MQHRWEVWFQNPTGKNPIKSQISWNPHTELQMFIRIAFCVESVYRLYWCDGKLPDI